MAIRVYARMDLRAKIVKHLCHALPHSRVKTMEIVQTIVKATTRVHVLRVIRAQIVRQVNKGSFFKFIAISCIMLIIILIFLHKKSFTMRSKFESMSKWRHMPKRQPRWSHMHM